MPTDRPSAVTTDHDRTGLVNDESSHHSAGSSAEGDGNYDHSGQHHDDHHADSGSESGDHDGDGHDEERVGSDHPRRPLGPPDGLRDEWQARRGGTGRVRLLGADPSAARFRLRVPAQRDHAPHRFQHPEWPRPGEESVDA